MLQNVIVRLQLQYSDWLIGQTLKWEFKKQRKRTKNNPPPKLFSYYVICATHETSTYIIYPISLSHNWKKKNQIIKLCLRIYMY